MAFNMHFLTDFFFFENVFGAHRLFLSLTVQADSNPAGVDRPSIVVNVCELPAMIPCDV